MFAPENIKENKDGGGLKHSEVVSQPERELNKNQNCFSALLCDYVLNLAYLLLVYFRDLISNGLAMLLVLLQNCFPCSGVKMGDFSNGPNAKISGFGTSPPSNILVNLMLLLQWGIEKYLKRFQEIHVLLLLKKFHFNKSIEVSAWVNNYTRVAPPFTFFSYCLHQKDSLIDFY